MLLQRLVEYAHREGDDGDSATSRPRFYDEVAVRYIVELDKKGNFLGLVDTSDRSNRKTKNGVRRSMPNIVRGSDATPLLFSDTLAKTLKVTSHLDPIKQRRKVRQVENTYRAYLELVSLCAEVTQLPEVRAVAKFLSSEMKITTDALDPEARVTFRVAGMLPAELIPVQEFWAAEHEPHDGPVMQCLLCGERGPVLEHYPAKIKGIPGGQTSGTTLTAVKGSAFSSYGLEDAAVAPTCSHCGEQFTRSLNQLLRNDATHISINKTAYVFWTREPSTFSFRDFLDSPQPEQVRALIDSVFSGHRSAYIDEPQFYCAAFSAHGGRAVVRDWIDTTLSRVQENLARWFERQRIVEPWGEPPRPFGIFPLARATVRDSDDLTPGVTDNLIRAALTGTALPLSLLSAALGRIRAEQEIIHARAALIALVLGTHSREVNMENTNTDPAYLCGRLLAVLEQAQAAAVHNIGTGIVQRSIGSAMRSPLSVFPRLMVQSEAHMKKLRRERPGAYHALIAKIAEIVAGISPNYPARLTIEQQGLFSLGYYHQRGADRAAAKAWREASENEEQVDVQENGTN